MEIFIIICVGIIIIYSIFRNYLEYRLIFSPFILNGIICFMVQVIGPLYWEIQGQRSYWGILIMDYIVQAELIFGLGYICYWISFENSQPRQIIVNSPVIDITEDDIIIDCKISIAYFLWVFFLVLYIIYLMSRGRSFLSQLTLGQAGTYSEDILSESDLKIWFLLVALDMMVPMCCIIVNVSKSKIKYIVFIVTVLLTISSGKRHLMLDMLLAPLILYFFINKKQPKWFTMILIGIVGYLLIGWIGPMRSVYKTGVGTLSGYNSETAWASTMTNLEVFKILCIYIPSLNSFNSFSYGTEYIRAFFQLIPSIIFPHKAQVISFFTRGGAREAIGEALLNSGTAGTIWSGFYASGWIIGVVVGMIILGRWTKRLMYRLETDRLTYLTEYAVMTSFTFQLLTRAFSSTLQTWFALVLPLYVLRKVSSFGEDM